MSLFNATAKQFPNGKPVMSFYVLQMKNIVTNNFWLSVTMRYIKQPNFMPNIDQISRNIRIVMDRKMQL